jgi:hypothetical protein
VNFAMHIIIEFMLHEWSHDLTKRNSLLAKKKRNDDGETWKVITMTFNLSGMLEYGLSIILNFLFLHCAVFFLAFFPTSLFILIAFDAFEAFRMEDIVQANECHWLILIGWNTNRRNAGSELTCNDILGELLAVMKQLYIIFGIYAPDLNSILGHQFGIMFTTGLSYTRYFHDMGDRVVTVTF